MANSPLTLLFFILLLLHFTSAHSSSDVEWWCRSMPHPDSCRHRLSHSNPPSRLTRSDFYKLSVKAALDNAVRAITRVNRLGNSCDGAAEKTAWLDCCKLFADTALQLNRTLSRSGRNSSVSDEQTWLSAALTNLNTCDKGFAELNANASFMKPALRYNLPDLISNCLAINNASLNATVTVAWGGVRGLMRVSGGADFVVAGDGSGDFKTVKEAVEAAASLRRRRRGRIVIHVKAGVYAEYLVIGNGVVDLTITGDGKGKTIITGQRSVALGFTTFNCPTVSKNSTNFLL